MIVVDPTVLNSIVGFLTVESLSENRAIHCAIKMVWIKGSVDVHVSFCRGIVTKKNK